MEKIDHRQIHPVVKHPRKLRKKELKGIARINDSVRVYFFSMGILILFFRAKAMASS